MLIALILILTWPSPCIQALYLIAVLLAAGEPSKAQHQAQSTKQSHHQAQSTKHKAQSRATPSTKQSHHLPSAISHPCSTGIACRVYDPGVAMRVHSFYGLGIADSNLTAC